MARQRVQEHPLGVKTWYSLKWSCERKKERRKDGGRVGEAVRARCCQCVSCEYVYVCMCACCVNERAKESECVREKKREREGSWRVERVIDG